MIDLLRNYKAKIENLSTSPSPLLDFWRDSKALQQMRKGCCMFMVVFLVPGMNP